MTCNYGEDTCGASTTIGTPNIIQPLLAPLEAPHSILKPFEIQAKNDQIPGYGPINICL